MTYLVCYTNADGTAAQVTPVAQPGETDQQAAARVAASLTDHPDATVIPAGLVAALRRADQPVTSVVSVGTFVGRLVPLYSALALSPNTSTLTPKWELILRPLMLLQTIDLSDPRLPGLLQLAQQDGLLTADQAAAVLAPP